MKELKLWLITATMGFLCPIGIKLAGLTALGWGWVILISFAVLGVLFLALVTLVSYLLIFSYDEEWEHI